MSEKVIALRSERMGQGDDVLGLTLLANFLRLLQESPAKPKAIFVYNAGVKLLTENSPVLAHLQELVAMGVLVQACRTCVDSYGLREQMKVGELSTMAQFVEYLQEYEVVTI